MFPIAGAALFGTMDDVTAIRNPDTTVSICELSPQVFLRRIDELVSLHLRAMGYGPAAFPQRRSLWAANSAIAGFTATVALDHDTPTAADPADLTQRVVGIAYGFPGTPTSWWYREVFRGLRASGRSTSEAAATLADYDEVSEVHVLPGYQGNGIGRRLLDNLLPRLSRPTAMLSTPEVPDEANAAWTLYRDLGFGDVLRNFHFASDSRPFGILARPRTDGRC
ncbi:hypothetical protein A606_04615 [Corynebacterium terpenotabidum Y-11]|uniref:N-acetyltransferase domain-containing protein n=2 Tax=Corynebacterium terpenotabidum TaxID=89154 RepID=S4XBS6_9CORY|nr:hypothetical protein A606_04615 [Corynebacterium terpenotabidum Y-11]